MIKVSIYNPQSGKTTTELYHSLDELPLDRWIQLGLRVTLQEAE